jgi:hypothetical protein
VEVDPEDYWGQPVRFTAWGREYRVVEVLGPHWEEQAPWWGPDNAGKSVDELRVKHWMMRTRGAQRDAVVEFVDRGGTWFVEGVED